MTINLIDSQLAKRLDVLSDDAVSSGKIVGGVILVSQSGQLTYKRPFGFADRELGVKMKVDSLFRLASMTKALVSASTLALAEKKIVNMQDSVTKFLPWFKPRLKSGETPLITLWHLLTHTSGLGYGFNLPPANEPYASLGISDGIDNPTISLEENLRRLCKAPLFFQPGSAWQYSLGTDVIGAVIEKATGLPLAQIVSEHITGPLKMVDTDFVICDASRLSRAYADAEIKGQPARLMPDSLTLQKLDAGLAHFSPLRAFNDSAYHSGGAGMIGTAADYLVFLEAIRQGGEPILDAHSVRLMTEDQVPGLLVGEPGVGFGLGFGTIRDPQTVLTPKNSGSYGWGGIYGTSYWIDPVSELSVVAMTNTALEGVDGSFRTDVINAVYGK